MFAADPRLLQKFAPVTRRVLVVDPNPQVCRLIADLMKGLGTREAVFEQDERRALDLARDFEPTLVFTEYAGPRLRGEMFTQKLRRSNLACRKAPVIMVTAEATATSIKAARDSGVHEFLRKPFTAGDLLKRIEAVTLKDHNWIEAVGYVGPDRRRFNSAEFKGAGKRKTDAATTPGGMTDAAQARLTAVEQPCRILRAALDQFDRDPNQALRAMREQAQQLKAWALSAGEARAAVSVAGLEVALTNPQATKMSLTAPVTKVLDLLYPQDAAPPQQRVG